MASTRGRTNIAGIVAAGVALAAFSWIAAAVLLGRAAGFDGAVRNAVHAWASTQLTGTMLWITQLGSSAFLIPTGLLTVGALAAAGRKHAAILLAAATLGGEGLTQSFKLLFHRTRPQAFFGLASPSNYSFVSGHAVTAFCFWGVLAAILAARMRSGWVRAGLYASAAVLVTLVGFSRIYLGVHYPTDVLAGYALAVVWLTLVRAGYEAWLRRGEPVGRTSRSAFFPWQLAKKQDGRPGAPPHRGC